MRDMGYSLLLHKRNNNILIVTNGMYNSGTQNYQTNGNAWFIGRLF
jgi:hypothetical protein